MNAKAVLLVLSLVLVGTVGLALAQSGKEAEGQAADQAGKPREALTYYVAALQKAPEGSADDQRLRETIIKLAQRLSPPPAIPEEARRFSIRGQVWEKKAKSPSDFDEAAKEFGKALRVAPWWADGYISQGVSLEKAGKYNEAIRSLKFSLLAAPGARDAEKIKDQIYALELRLEPKWPQEKAMSPATVQKAVETFADFLLRYLVALAAVGALAMAILEAWKKVFDSRTRYHMRAVQRWIGVEGGHDFAAAAMMGRTVAPPPPELAYAELIHLTTGTELPRDEVEARRLFAYGEALSNRAMIPRIIPRSAELALFSLELERMMGHIQDAGDAALKDPKQYSNLYRFLTWGACDSDIEDWSKQAAVIPLDEKPDRKKASERANLYARLHGAAKRKLDGFQLYTGYRWTNQNQLAANILGALTLFCALVGAQLWSGKDMTSWTYVLFFVVSLTGGALAPVAKDIVMALQKVKSRV